MPRQPSGGSYLAKKNSLTVRVSTRFILDINAEDLIKDEFQCLLNSFSEPLSHVMLKEAKKVLDRASEGSVIVMAMSAAGVAIKEVLYKRVPDAGWLLDNLNSPPLLKIMKGYVPQLFPELDLFYNTEERKEGFLYDLKNAVSIRNDLVHKGQHPNNLSEKANKVICVVERLLWGCDYFNGHQWAFEYAQHDS